MVTRDDAEVQVIPPIFPVNDSFPRHEASNVIVLSFQMSTVIKYLKISEISK